MAGILDLIMKMWQNAPLKDTGMPQGVPIGDGPGIMNPNPNAPNPFRGGGAQGQDQRMPMGQRKLIEQQQQQNFQETGDKDLGIQDLIDMQDAGEPIPLNLQHLLSPGRQMQLDDPLSAQGQTRRGLGRASSRQDARRRREQTRRQILGQ